MGHPWWKKFSHRDKKQRQQASQEDERRQQDLGQNASSSSSPATICADQVRARSTSARLRRSSTCPSCAGKPKTVLHGDRCGLPSKWKRVLLVQICRRAQCTPSPPARVSRAGRVVSVARLSLPGSCSVSDRLAHAADGEASHLSWSGPLFRSRSGDHGPHRSGHG
jgi:hypothetical protein